MTAPVTGITPIYGLEYPVEGEPIRYTRQKLERTMLAIEEALSNGGVAATGAADLLTVSGRVSVLEAVAAAQAYATIQGTGTQSLPNNTWTALAMTGTETDPLSGHSLVTNTSRWVCPAGQGGLYLAGGSANFAANGTGARFTGVRKNGAETVAANGAQYTPSGTGTTVVPTAVWAFVLAPTDYLELYGYQSSGAALNVNLTNSGFWLSRITKF
jgi:hypothetical protein